MDNNNDTYIDSTIIIKKIYEQLTKKDFNALSSDDVVLMVYLFTAGFKSALLQHGLDEKVFIQINDKKIEIT
jgi:hypothetical protein